MSNVGDFDEICELNASEQGGGDPTSASDASYDGTAKDFNNGAEVYEILVTGLVCAASGALSMFFIMSQKQKKMQNKISEHEMIHFRQQNETDNIDDGVNDLERKSLYATAKASPTAAII
jgi:hypothetical protein